MFIFTSNQYIETPMKLTIRNTAVFCVFLVLISFKAFAQQPIIEQDKQLEKLLKTKEKLERDNDLFSGYTVQIHNGSLEDAREKRKDYTKLKKDWPSSIHYETPNYKLWVGNFDSRLEADKALLSLKDDFPSAFVLKPDKK